MSRATTAILHLKLPGGMVWDDLIVVDCRVCRRRLLSPKCEDLRKQVDARTRANLSPPPGGTLTQTFLCGTRPVPVQFFVCAACAQ